MGRGVKRWRTQCVTYAVKWSLSIIQGYELELGHTIARTSKDLKKNKKTIGWKNG